MLKEINGHIDHRILLNYRIDPAVVSEILPTGMTPVLVDGFAYGGICQLSLSKMRPKGLPAALVVIMQLIASLWSMMVKKVSTSLTDTLAPVLIR